jgi:hypothetical protein
VCVGQWEVGKLQKKDAVEGGNFKMRRSIAPVGEHDDFCTELLRRRVGAGYHAHVTAHADEVAGLRRRLLPPLFFRQQEKLRLGRGWGVAVHSSTIPQQQICKSQRMSGDNGCSGSGRNKGARQSSLGRHPPYLPLEHTQELHRRAVLDHRHQLRQNLS